MALPRRRFFLLQGSVYDKQQFYPGQKLSIPNSELRKQLTADAETPAADGGAGDDVRRRKLRRLLESLKKGSRRCRAAVVKVNLHNMC